MSTLKYIALGIGTLLAGRYLISLGRTKDKVTTLVKASRDKITASGLSLIIGYNIQNPTKTTVKITPPLIKVLYNDKLLATSTMSSVDVPQDVKDEKGRIIAFAFKETGWISTSILIPWINLLNIGSEVLSKFQNSSSSEKIVIDIESNSQVYTHLGSYPLDQRNTIAI